MTSDSTDNAPVLMGEWPDDLVTPEVVTETDPWDMLEDEPSRQFHAFTLYRDLGPGRTYAAAYALYRDHYGLASDQPSRNYSGWTRQFRWKSRAEAFDAWQDSQRVQAAAYAQARAREVIADKLVPIVERFASILLGDRVKTEDGYMIVGQIVDWQDNEEGVEVPVIQLGRVTSAQVALFKQWCSMAGLDAPRVVEMGGAVDVTHTLRPTRDQLEAAKAKPAAEKALDFKRLVGGRGDE